MQKRSAGLHWTGQPLMDMAVAGLVVFADRDRPEDLLESDLERFAAWAERYYFTADLTSWISVVFTSNFMNPTFPVEKKKEVLRDILTSYQRPGILTERCTFFAGLPAQQRVARDLLPMLMGRGPINFFPGGQPGLPLSGLAITALQGLAVAAPLVSGKALIVDADDPEVLLDIVRAWQPVIRKRASDSDLLSEKGKGWTSPRTRLVEAVLSSLDRVVPLDPGMSPAARKADAERLQGGLTGYHLSNSGQGPDVQIFPLRHPALVFLRSARQPPHASAWNAVERASTWAAGKDKDATYGTRIDLYEQLFGLPEAAPDFVRRFLLRPFINAIRPQEPAKPARAAKTSPVASAPAPDLGALWSLTELFLVEVIGMDKQRITALRELGDALATRIVGENDMGLFRDVYEARGPGPLRRVLLRTALQQVGQGEAPLITMDGYIRVFMEDEELARVDFYLARDLLKMRVIEQLHAVHFLQKNRDTIKDITVPDADTLKEEN